MADITGLVYVEHLVGADNYSAWHHSIGIASHIMGIIYLLAMGPLPRKSTSSDLSGADRSVRRAAHNGAEFKIDTKGCRISHKGEILMPVVRCWIFFRSTDRQRQRHGHQERKNLPKLL